MPIITHALLYLGYALVSLTVGLALNQVGGQDVGSAFLGAIALFSACAVTHAGITSTAAARRVANTEKRMKGDMERLRAAHKEVIADMDSVASRMDAIEAERTEVSSSRAIAPSPEPQLQMIEQIVDKLGRALDSRFDEYRRVSGPSSSSASSSGFEPQRPAADGPIERVREALIENRIELHLQPIVQLPQRRTAFYEGFTRLKDASGRLIMPQEFIPAAEKAGLMSSIDNVLMFRCVQIVRKLMKQDRRVGIFCNISPTALSDESFFPQFLDFMRENIDLAGSVILEIPQASFEARTSIEARAMAKLVDLGFRFSIDKVSSIQIDLPDLERSGVRYVKVGAQLLSDQLVRDSIRPKSAITREIASPDVAAVFQRYGIDLIAERIESEELVLETLDLDVPYGQGHLFGAPRAIKESLMEETAPPRDFLAKQGRVA